MLQQTQVKTVLPRYVAWFDRFSEISLLAAAPLDDVLKAWEGLGYYRRARLLHQSAKIIVHGNGGLFPEEFEDILALPGIGRSTAGAIASICFATKRPVLDGNVRRVLQRWEGSTAIGDGKLWQLAQAAVDIAPEPGEWNQAMMELGAMICSSRCPACSVCPLHPCRSAFAAPVKLSRKPVQVRDAHWQVHLWMDADKGIWLEQRPETGIWAGLWAPPITELRHQPSRQPCHIHRLTHRRLHLYGIRKTSAPTGGGRWVLDISQLALPTGIHRLLQKHALSR